MKPAEQSSRKHRDIEGGKFFSFFLDDEEYGFQVLKVMEIIGIHDITRVPRTPRFVKGVINLRGRIIPVVDLRLKFGMEEKPYDQETCIIVVEITRDDTPVTMGVIVDRVSEVLDIDAEHIEHTPSFGTDIDTDFILGIGRTVEKKVIIILDVDRILSSREVAVISSTGQTEEAGLDDTGSSASGEKEQA
jgi:purine-binding chemotaxis protein CheW